MSILSKEKTAWDSRFGAQHPEPPVWHRCFQVRVDASYRALREISSLRVVALLPLLFLASCGKSDETGEPPPDRIQLLDAGSEPRTGLRRTIDSNNAQALDVRTRMTLSLAQGGEPLPQQEIPTTVARLIIEEQAGTTESAVGNITIESTTIEAEGTDPELADSFRKELATQNPSGITFSFSRPSRTRQMQMEFPDGEGALPMIRHFLGNLEQALRLLDVPLPTEAIGVGARWRVLRTVEMMGMSLTEEIDYLLLEKSGDRLRIETRSILSGLPQTIHMPGMPEGSSCQLISLDANGSGVLTLDLTLSLATSVETTQNLRMEIEALSRGEEHVLDGLVELKVWGSS